MRLPLRTKLILIVVAPLLVLVAAAGRGVQLAARDARAGQRAADRVELSLAATDAARELAQERVLSTQPRNDTRTANALTFQRDRTSQAVDALRASLRRGEGARLGGTPALHQLERLSAAREAVDRRTPDTAEVLGTYDEIIDPLLDLDRTADALAGIPALAGRLTSFQALSRALQEAVVERELVRSALATGWLGAADHERLVTAVARQRVWLEQFEREADSGQLARYAKAVGIPEATIATRLREQALAGGPDSAPSGNVEAWTSAMDRKIEALEEIADDTGAELAAGADRRRAAADGRLDRSLMVLGAVVALTLAVLLFLHRWALRPLRRLAGAAEHAARVALPEAVDVARDEGRDAARRALPPVEVPRDPELGGLATAFNETQEMALALATDEAELRSKVNAVFLNFGHRTQDLVTDQLRHIDELEARIDDPDTLSDLFTLDHLSTRLRRNAESLMVMAGAASPRPWGRPLSIMNVVRAAVAEALDYSRVDLDTIEPGGVEGPAANEVSHLLAELIDNALSISPPEGRVRIAGAWVEGERYLVTVTGGGSLSDRQLDEANARIAGSNESDPGMSRHFGMYVAGRFARRHGIDVRLVPARGEGTAAEVLLPELLMAGTTMACPTTTGS
ncbi:MAG TPA: nitrate- and nitrite sensing domain-containing protein [Acidimicrobiales bacterium]